MLSLRILTYRNHINIIRITYVQMLQICCKGTAFFGNMQVFEQKNLHICKKCSTFAGEMSYSMPIPILRLPSWVTRNALLAYVCALVVVSLVYSSYSLPWYYMVAGFFGVMTFFVIGLQMSRNMTIARVHRPENFEIQVVSVAFGFRLVFVLFLYWIFKLNFNNPFGFENADAFYYDQLGRYVSELILKGDYHFYDRISQWSGMDDISDMGYGVYLGFVYWLTDNSVIAARLLKCVWSSLTVLLMYRLAQRNVGEQAARLTAIFCALWPNFWYYCSAHLKEVEMVFLTVLFIEQADQMLRSRQFTAWKVIPVLLIAAIIFTFRTPLGIVVLLALVFSLVMSSTRVVTWGKRIIVGLLAIVLIGVIAGNRIEERADVLVEQVREGSQAQNMEWRSSRDQGNSLAKYASSAVFAPMIFTLPFPSMVRPFDDQDIQQLNHGGNFIKNIVSYFTILALVILLMSGYWREMLLPLSFMLGYLVMLTLSSFAHSERFHQPAMPFEFMFAAYGVGIALSKKKYRRWFGYWCVVMFLAAVAWNWFKLKGRGLT